MEKIKDLGAKIIITSFICLFISSLAYAEIILTKDGQVIYANVIEKTEDTVWYEKEKGDIIEEIGIDILEVENILNDDGSVSEYSPRYK